MTSRSSVSYVIYDIHKIVIITVCSTYSITFNIIFRACLSYTIPCCDQTPFEHSKNSKVSQQTGGTLDAQKHLATDISALRTHLLRIKAVHNIMNSSFTLKVTICNILVIKSHSARKPMTITFDCTCQWEYDKIKDEKLSFSVLHDINIAML